MSITVAGACLLPEKSCERPVFVTGQDGPNKNKVEREDLLTHQDRMVPVYSVSAQWSGARDFENSKMLHEKKAKKGLCRHHDSSWSVCVCTQKPVNELEKSYVVFTTLALSV